MDAAMATALGVAVDHYAAGLIQELILQRERKAMELEELAARAMCGKVLHNPTLLPGHVSLTWDELAVDVGEELDDAWGEVNQRDRKVRRLRRAVAARDEEIDRLLQYNNEMLAAWRAGIVETTDATRPLP